MNAVVERADDPSVAATVAQPHGTPDVHAAVSIDVTHLDRSCLACYPSHRHRSSVPSWSNTNRVHPTSQGRERKP
jgi:hypothetical protein